MLIILWEKCAQATIGLWRCTPANGRRYVEFRRLRR